MKQEPDETLQNQNPYRSPKWHEPVKAKLSRPALLWWYRLLAVIQCLTIMIGVVAAFIHIESIIASGSVLTSIGLVMTVLSSRVPFVRGVVFSASGPAISVFCFMLILLNNWGPGDAHGPVSGLAAIYGVIFLPLGLATILVEPPAHTTDTSSISTF